jgi:WD40 repeat protein
VYSTPRPCFLTSLFLSTSTDYERCSQTTLSDQKPLRHLVVAVSILPNTAVGHLLKEPSSLPNRDTHFHFGLAWSPDSQHIVVGGVTRKCECWMLPQARLSTSIVVLPVGAVAWSPDGTRIAAGSDDQTVHLFKATDGTRIYIYQGQAGHIDALTWSPTSSLIASGSNNGTVQVWQAE